MKKTMKKFLAIALTLLLMWGVAACGNNGETDDGTKPGGDDPGTDSAVLTPDGNYLDFRGSIPDLTDTVHSRSIGTTDSFLIANGVTAYKLLIPANASGGVGTAMNEFRLYMEEATGIRLALETNPAAAYAADAKYISFGATEMLRGTGEQIDYAGLGTQGYRIFTKGQSIFVAGNDKGVLFGAYDLLQVLVEFEQLTNKYYYINKNVNTLALPALDINEAPDIEVRITPHGNLDQASETVRNRFRMSKMNELYIRGASVHSILDIVSDKQLGDVNASYHSDIQGFVDTHPAWFSQGSRRHLCYTARGDAGEYAAMVAHTVARCKQLIDADPLRNVLSLSQEDINEWCVCPACSALHEQYGTNAASQIFFVNDVAKEVEEWAKTAHPGRQIMFEILAYHQTLAAPVTKNGDGSYTPVNNIKLRDNIIVMVAQIGGDFISNIMSGQCAGMRAVFESWSAVADRYLVWNYDLYSWNYMVTLDSYGGMQDMVKYLVNLGAYVYYAQGAYNLRNNTNFEDLKSYLFSKLEWNANIDMAAYIDNYFSKLYGDAAEIMKQAFFQMRAQLRIQTLLGKDASIHTNVTRAVFWPKQYLVRQLRTFDEALAVIQRYAQTDPDYYRTVTNQIALETIGARFLMIELYRPTMSDTEWVAFRDAFIEDVLRLDVNRILEDNLQGAMSRYIDSLYSK
ncbi:MAG: DUF4838 domain-containing protein [Clostridiales bacterium]|jgi:hypothetical protein|nr:DUF4838 domain-containing protein [Clostridiales bacterium]